MTARPVQTENSEYETGARKYPASAPQPEDGMPTVNPFGLTQPEDETNEPTVNPFGLTQPVDETNEKTRQSDNVDQRGGSPAIEKVAGAGPAIAKRSKDAKAGKTHARPSPM